MKEIEMERARIARIQNPLFDYTFLKGLEIWNTNY